MGCSDSKSVDVQSNSNQPQKKPVKAIVQQKTVKEWFDECLMLPPLSGEGYKPEPIPDHYIEEERKFEHDAADSSFLDKQITVVPNPNMNNQQCSSWHYKRKSNGYKPKDNCGFVEIEIEPSSPRKRIVAVGGLYLGSVSAANIDLGEMLTAESVHSLVILGNLFDILSIDELHCIPTETQTIEEKLQSAIPVLDQIRKLVDDHRIQVYYLRGSHEQELTRAAIDRLLGDKITYIPQQSLVIANKADKDMYTMRFTTGQQWDLLNYVDLPNEELLASKPIGYYLHRAAAQTPNFSVSHLLHPMAERVPKDFNPTLLAHFSQQPFQEQITTMLMQMALQCKDVSIIRESRCVVSEGKYVTGSTIIDYPFLKYLINKLGEEQVFTMFKAMAGDWSSAVTGFSEDVVIIGLGDVACTGKAGEGSREIYFASTGSVSKRSKQMTCVIISCPKQGSNGKIEIEQLNSKVEQNGHSKQVEAVTSTKSPEETVVVEDFD